MTLTESDRALAASVAAAHPMEDALKQFTVRIGPRAKPHTVLEVYAADSVTAAAQHIGLAREGERVEVKLSEEWLTQSDLAHHRAKVSGQLDRERDERALLDQIKHQPTWGVF